MRACVRACLVQTAPTSAVESDFIIGGPEGSSPDEPVFAFTGNIMPPDIVSPSPLPKKKCTMYALDGGSVIDRSVSHLCDIFLSLCLAYSPWQEPSPPPPPDMNMANVKSDPHFQGFLGQEFDVSIDPSTSVHHQTSVSRLSEQDG